MPSKKIAVDLFYDVISPYSYFAFEHLLRHSKLWPSVNLRLKPFLLGGIMKAAGNKPPMVVPNKAIYMLSDINRISKLLAVNCTIPKHFGDITMVKGSLRAMRFITAIDIATDGKQTEQLSREFYKRTFGSHLDIADIESIRQAARDAGLSEDVIDKAIVKMDQQAAKDRLRAYTEEAFGHNSFGAPTIVAHLPTGPEMFFGSDRIEILANVLGLKYEGPLTQFAKL